MLVNLQLFAFYAFAVAAITLTVTKSPIFKWWRDFTTVFDDVYLLEHIPTLWSCPFCFSFWASVLVLWCSPFPWITGFWSFIFNAFALMGAASLIAGIIYRNFKGEIDAQV